MWSDNETEVDLLNVQHIVEAVVSVVADDRLSPVTVGVYGDWGSGKSSVIRMVRSRFETQQDVVVVYFNGWRFEGYENAKAALATTILEEIKREVESEKGKLTKVRDRVSTLMTRMWWRIDHLRIGRTLLSSGINAGIATGAVAITGATVGAPLAAGALLSIAIASLIQEGKKVDGKAIADLISEQAKKEGEADRETHDMIRDFHRDFAELVEKLEIRRLVVIVDDLDRCLPPNVIETLEAIRLFLSAPKTAFVIAADEAVIRHAVAQRFPTQTNLADKALTGQEFDVGARYLEKLIQVPVRVPPLSPADLHGYLNLLFAEQHEENASAFAKLCERARAAAAFNAVSFRADNAEALLGAPLSEDLKADLSLAEQLAPVLAICAEGNPRQTKRFLNALILRLAMAKSRGVTMERAVAAKMLLLEYFLPIAFRGLAQSAAVSYGKPPELEALEAKVRGRSRENTQGTKKQAVVQETETEKAGDGRRKVGAAKQSAAAEVKQGDETSPLYAIAALESERFRVWLAADPPLAGVDLRPYVYFAVERYSLPLALAQQLSPQGRDVLRLFLQPGESVHNNAAKRVATLPLSDVSAIVAELATSARRSEDLKEKDSPLYALFKIANARPEVAGEILAAISGLPAKDLPSAAAVQVGSIGQRPESRGIAHAVLGAWAKQNANPSLASAATSRAEQLRTSTGSQGQ